MLIDGVGVAWRPARRPQAPPSREAGNSAVRGVLMLSRLALRARRLESARQDRPIQGCRVGRRAAAFPPLGPQAASPVRLTGWKEIAAHLGRSVRTVQRWEKGLALPVRRMGRQGKTVLALPAELDAWRAAVESTVGDWDRPGESAGAGCSPTVPAVLPSELADQVAARRHRGWSLARSPRYLAALAAVVVVILGAFWAVVSRM